MVLTYFLNDFEMVPVAPIFTGITLVFTFHIRCIYIVRSLYFKLFSASFLVTFLSPGIATSINIHVPYYYFFLWLCSPARAMASSSTRFLDHTQRRATIGRTPLDE
jgi:hypothetical protein